MMHVCGNFVICYFEVASILNKHNAQYGNMMLLKEIFVKIRYVSRSLWSRVEFDFGHVRLSGSTAIDLVRCSLGHSLYITVLLTYLLHAAQPFLRS
jgi:hypothetical protein